MCEWNERSQSIVTPRSLTLVLDVSEMPSSVSRQLDSVILKCLGPTTVTSVVLLLRSRKLLVIHVLTSLSQGFILGTIVLMRFQDRMSSARVQALSLGELHNLLLYDWMIHCTHVQTEDSQ